MIRRIGDDLGRLRQRHLVVAMEKVCAETGDGAAMIQGHGPEPANVLAVRQLVFIHQPEWARECVTKRNSVSSQSFSQSVGQILQHIAAPGELFSVLGLFAGRKEFSLSLSKIFFDGSAEMFWSQWSVLIHAEA